MRISDYIDADLLDRFEFYNYNHAIEIITQAFPKEWSDVVECLRKLDITTDDLREAGGNETKIPKKFDDVLYPCGWREIRISGDLHIKFYPRQADQRGRFSSVPFEERVTENYIDGHNIDFLKGRIAFDLEWNSKDQTFDRDLLAMRTYYDCDIVSAGIIVTRSQELNDVFKTVYDFDKNSHSWKPIMRKYGASTTLTAFFDAKSLPELVNPLCQKYWELTFSAMEEKYPDAYPAHIFKNIGRLREIKEQICLRDSKSQEE